MDSGNQLAIEAVDLIKVFGTHRSQVRALDGLTLCVNRGEVFGLIGPDGAGKSTLTRTLLGLLSPDEGSSRVLGWDSLRSAHRIRGRVGYIAQEFSLPPDLTVIENLRFFADVHGLPRRQREAMMPELLAFSGLEQFTGRLAARLSGGMKKKLALACSLIHSPDVLLLDEPTLGVDPVSRREFWALLGRLNTERQVTVMVCTPYMDEAERCSRVGLMYQGRMVAADTPAAIKARLPTHLLELTPRPYRHAAEALIGLDGVLEVQRYGRLLHVFVESPRAQADIERRLALQDIECVACRQIAPRMEQAFVWLMSRIEGTS